MQVKVFEAMNLIVGLYVAQENVCTLVEVVVLYLFYWVYRSIIFEIVWECWVVCCSRIYPLPITSPVLEFLIAALYRASRIHVDSCAYSIRSTRNSL